VGQVILEELKAMEMKGLAFEEALLRDVAWYHYCKTAPHPYPSVMLDSMGIGALWGQICP
jgi:hypothetical protein